MGMSAVLKGWNLSAFFKFHRKIRGNFVFFYIKKTGFYTNIFIWGMFADKRKIKENSVCTGRILSFYDKFFIRFH